MGRGRGRVGDCGRCLGSGIGERGGEIDVMIEAMIPKLNYSTEAPRRWSFRRVALLVLMVGLSAVIWLRRPTPALPAAPPIAIYSQFITTGNSVQASFFLSAKTSELAPAVWSCPTTQPSTDWNAPVGQ